MTPPSIGRLVDAAGAQPPQMLELQHVGAGVEPEQRVVERRRQHQAVGTAKAALVELRRGGERVLQGAVERRPSRRLRRADVRRPSTGRAGRNRAGRNRPCALRASATASARGLYRAQIDRLAVFDMGGDAADAELKALPQHRHRHGAADHRAGVARARAGGTRRCRPRSRSGRHRTAPRHRGSGGRSAARARL